MRVSVRDLEGVVVWIMRYIKIPKNVQIPAVGPDGTLIRSLFSFMDLLQNSCWTHEDWREDEASAEAFVRVYTAFEDAEVGKIVALSDADYERFKKIVTLSGQKLRPDIAPELMFLMHAVLTAGSKEPK